MVHSVVSRSSEATVCAPIAHRFHMHNLVHKAATVCVCECACVCARVRVCACVRVSVVHNHKIECTMSSICNESFQAYQARGIYLIWLIIFCLSTLNVFLWLFMHMCITCKIYIIPQTLQIKQEFMTLSRM